MHHTVGLITEAVTKMPVTGLCLVRPTGGGGSGVGMPSTLTFIMIRQGGDILFGGQFTIGQYREEGYCFVTLGIYINVTLPAYK